MNCVKFTSQELLTEFKKASMFQNYASEYQPKIEKEFVENRERKGTSLYNELARKKNIENFFNVTLKRDFNETSFFVPIPNKWIGFYLHFDGSELKRSAIVSSEYQALTNGQIIKGKLKGTKKENDLLLDFVQKYNQYGKFDCNLQKTIDMTK